MMRFFNTITGTYALALLLYALLFKIVFLPFTIKQQKNQIKMAKLTPKIELIRAKYKGRTDQPTLQKQQQEIMELQQKEGYSPLSGCLPLLIQFPIIILLYAVIQSPISYIAKPTDKLDNYNDNYASASLSDYEAFCEYYGITEDNRKEISDIDIVRALYQEFSTDSAATKAEKLKKFDKNARKAVEIALVGNLRSFVDDGYSSPADLRELFEKEEKGEELTEEQKKLLADEKAKVERLAQYDTEEKRAALISSYGVEYDTIPNFKLWGVNLAANPSLKNLTWPQGILCIIPILAAAAQWFSMWLMRKLNGNGGATAPQDQQAAASMRIMDLAMPLMTVFLAFNFSGMLGIYWIYQSLLGLITSLILAKAMPIPKFTEDELKELRRQQKEIEKEQRIAAKKGTKYRSLHYIDDDDYEELPPVPGEDKSDSKKIGSDIPEIKD